MTTKQLEAKEYLSQAFDVDRKIERTILKIEKMKSSLYGKSSNYSERSGDNSQNENSVENTVLKVIEYEERKDKLIDVLVGLKLEIEGVINKIPNEKYKDILERRYLLFQKWEEIAEELNYSVQWIHKLHRRALTEVQKIHKSLL